MQTGPSYNLHIAEQLGRDFRPIRFRNMKVRDYRKVCAELSRASVTEELRPDGKTWRFWKEGATVVASAVIKPNKSVELMEVNNPYHAQRLGTIIRNGIRYG